MSGKTLYGLALIGSGLYLSWLAGEAVGLGIGALFGLDTDIIDGPEEPAEPAGESEWGALSRLERRRLELEVDKLERELSVPKAKRRDPS